MEMRERKNATIFIQSQPRNEKKTICSVKYVCCHRRQHSTVVASDGSRDSNANEHGKMHTEVSSLLHVSYEISGCVFNFFCFKYEDCYICSRTAFSVELETCINLVDVNFQNEDFASSVCVCVCAVKTRAIFRCICKMEELAT